MPIHADEQVGIHLPSFHLSYSVEIGHENTTFFYEDVVATIGVPNIKLARECAC